MENAGKKEIILFGKTWKASNGYTNQWHFAIRGDKVVWDFDMLFDANTWEHDYGYAEFGKEKFKRFLEEFFRNGFTELDNGYGNGRVSMKRQEERHIISINISPAGWGTGLETSVNENDITPAILELLE